MPLTSQDIADILSAPIQINNRTLKNRVVMGPMAVHYVDRDGRPTDQTVAYFEARARGGASMIIVGGVSATTSSLMDMPDAPKGMRFDSDIYLADLKRVADAVHKYDVPIIAEIVPSLGRMARTAPGGRLISASPVNVVVPEDRLPKGFVMPGGFSTKTPEEATIEEIQRLESEMIDAADRAKRAGWDGVEVAAHMSYFGASFLSPRTNQRTDEYGGSLENRARFLVNAVKGIRARVGRDFIVGLRILANDYVPDSPGTEGFVAIAKRVEAEGIDYVAPSPGCYETMDLAMPAFDGVLVDRGDARVFKQTMAVPVLVQGMHDPERGAQAVRDGHADIAMLARPMLADPEYANKVCSGRAQEIVRCDRDNQCLRRLMFGMPIRCSVNPRAGLESRAPGSPPPAKRIVEVPKEKLMLSLTSSRPFMKMAMTLLAAKAKKAEEAAAQERHRVG